MMTFLRLSCYLLVFLAVGSETLARREQQVDSEFSEGMMKEELANGIGAEMESSRSVRRGPAAAADAATAPANKRHRELSSAIPGSLTTSAISPTDNPTVCPNEIGLNDCLNGCPSLWYTVIGTGLSMTASSCAPGTYADYDQRIIVWGGTSCSDKTCVGASTRQCIGIDGLKLRVLVAYLNVNLTLLSFAFIDLRRSQRRRMSSWWAFEGKMEFNSRQRILHPGNRS
jgi:hypothetical protein